MAPVTVISSLPKFVAPSVHGELISSTPASFSDIPPVLRHQEENVSIRLLPAIEEISEEDCKVGTLYVIDSVLAFISSTGRGFQVEYPNITLHAIKRTEGEPSVYCQIESNPGADEGDEEDFEFTELTIIPQDASKLESIFDALSLCNALHPDPNASVDDGEDMVADFSESNFEVFTGDGDQELSEVGRAALAHLESIITYPPGSEHADATEDAEEDEDEEGKNETREENE
ncbi:hypothetical protein BOTBODRAFT_32820 [Botryobasidium botryosum FD-172 SS1]|uniref:Methylosome subunit pICln n=1 Tax=Botryobasidium botryosum (strain FD-172 SS1) TaxID=930990 RepID=A0A067MRA0_BOTB1|nr:hypothetical protein BOTBODRAFT_32820 [Botryobasidium botryosum FD-172 SS1]